VNLKRKVVIFAVMMITAFTFTTHVMADDLYVVASKATQKAVQNWLGFLESKEIIVEVVTPEAFADHKMEKYIVIIGSISEQGGIADIAKEALKGDEFQSVNEAGKGRMFMKSGVWNPGQEVILIVGHDQKDADDARKAAKEEWFEMFSQWFEIEEGAEGLHAY